MLRANPYLHFMGNAETAMKFYQSVLNGEITLLSRYGDIPGGEKLPKEDQAKLIHASLVFGKGGLIMATDYLASMGQKLELGNNYYICLDVETEAEADKIFAALSADGKIDMPMNKTFWGAYFGICRDPFGVQWMINFAPADLHSPAPVR